MEMLGAITSLLGAGLGAGAQAQNVTTQLAGLQFQKDQAAKAERLSTATRTDAYGNQQKYNPATNTWESILTPTQRGIVNAGETEQLRSLTEDAQQNRRVRGMKYARALGAEEPYNAAVTGYKYDQPASELSDRGNLETLMLQANQDRAKGAQDSLARQAIRLGRGADIPALIKATDDKLGESIPDALLKAYTGAKTQRAGEVAAHDSQYLPEISKWQGIMDDAGGDSQQRFSQVPQELDSMQGQQASAMLQALQNSTSGIGGAYKALGAAEGKSPNLDKAASLFAGIGKSQNKAAAKGTSTGSSGGGDDTDYSLTNTSDPWNNSYDWNNFNQGGDFLF